MDYGVFSAPNNLTKYQLDIVNSKHLSILGDDVERNLKVPKWILYKDADFLIWGICCENSLIAPKYQETTDKNRPVRGFFSVVITEFDKEDLKLPFDINYFRELYKAEIGPYWNQREQHRNNTSGFIAGNFKYISASHNNYVDLLNADIFQCQSLGCIDKEGVVAAALTLKSVSLLIDNDNIEQATNRKGAFMNCLTSSVGFGLYPVKQQCPKCKKNVSSFTATGVCPECKDAEELKKYRIKKAEEDMDKQFKIEFGEARNKIAELENEIEIANAQLKKKNQLVRILAIVTVVLLVALFYTQTKFSLKFFDEKQEVQHFPDNTPHNGNPVNQDNDFVETFGFSESTIDVVSDAHEKFLIKVESNTNNYRVASNVDWIKVLSKTKDQIVIEILANKEATDRVGKITVSCGNGNSDSVEIKQKGENN